jgi:hypothetical protein
MPGGDNEMRTQFWLGSQKRRNYQEGLVLDERIVLKLILGSSVGGSRVDYSGLR